MRKLVAGPPMPSTTPGRVPRDARPFGIRRPAGGERTRHASHMALPAPAAERFLVDWELPGSDRAN